MQFKTDENMPVEAADDLRQAGHDTLTVADQHLAGQPDERVAEICRTERLALVTLDLDFSDIRAYPPKRGIVSRNDPSLV
jgi:predicted nuclease of predicted toxin-antitoxin system